MMKQKNKLLLLAVFAALAVSLMFAGSASAKYIGDGAVPNPVTGGWDLPADKGFCVTSVMDNGTMLLDLSVGNSRPDCLATIFPAYTTKEACIDNNGTNTEGSHYWTSTCILTGSNPAVAITLSDLDRTKYMCEQNGGTWKSACTGNWTAMGPTWSAAPVSETTGGTDGFCYTRIRIASYTDNNECLTGGTYPDDNTIKFGYKWGNESGSDQCTYAYGIAGPFGGTVDRSNVYSSTVKNMRGFVTANAGETVDLSTKTQGQCQFDGYSFSNHTTKGSTAVIGTSTIATPITQVRAGCLSCHNNTTQYNGYAGRWKSDYLKQGHKNMLRKVKPGENWAGPNADGVLEIYTTAAAGQTLHFDNATATGSYGNKPLMYLFGDWMAPAPDGLDTVIWDNNTAKYNGGSGYSCASCHTTGWRNDNTSVGLCTLSSKTTSDNCITAGGTWYPSKGTQGYGIGGAEPATSWPDYKIGPDFGYDNTIPGITGQWDWDGINCNRCHKVAYDPNLPINDQGVNAPPGYTTHETDIFSGEIIVNICFGCHQSIAKVAPYATTSNADIADATKIPVKNSAANGAYLPEWSGHVIGASFLNSPHGKYTGGIVPNSLGKYDLAPGGTFASTFKGKVCRSSTSVGGGSVLETKADGHVIASLADCNRANGKAVGDVVEYGYWQDEAGPGNCTTCHNVHESLFVADAKEPLRRECTTCHTKSLTNMNHPAGGATPAGLAGANASVACEICHMPKATSGGFPMHLWRINSNASYRSFPTAQEFNDNTSKIGKTAPDGSYANATWVDLDYACGQCHGGGNGQAATIGTISSGSAALTVFDNTGFIVNEKIRVEGAGVSGDLETAVAGINGNTITLGAKAATSVTNAAVTQNATNNALGYFSKAGLAALANGIHLDTMRATFSYTFGSPATNTVNFNGGLSVCGSGSCSEFIWDFGDGSFGTGKFASHTYSATATYNVKLTVSDGGSESGTKTLPISVTMPDTRPKALGMQLDNGVCLSILDNSWKATIVDASTDDVGVNQVTVNWGDGSLLAVGIPGQTFTHTYLGPGSYNVTHKAVDTVGQQNARTCTVTPAYFSIGGTVSANDGVSTTIVPMATVYVKNASNQTVRTVTTTATGTYNANKLKPGTYTVSVQKAGYTFPASSSITVGGSKTGIDIVGTKP